VQTWYLVLAAIIVVLPIVLMIAFNHGDRTDARGRRTNTAWTSSRHQNKI
jgi:hypothetical protein